MLPNKEEDDGNIELMIALTLFSKDVFHIFHKCICQQLIIGNIEQDLLVELRQASIDLLNKQ